MSEIYQRYEKPALNIDQQVEILVKKWLIVKNLKRILHYLCFIGYHCPSGYFRTFQNQNTSEHIFKNDSAFDSIELYFCILHFDATMTLLKEETSEYDVGFP